MERHERTMIYYVGIDPSINSCGLYAWGEGESFPITHAINHLRDLRARYDREYPDEKIIFVTETYPARREDMACLVASNRIIEDIKGLFNFRTRKYAIMKLKCQQWRRLLWGSATLVKGRDMWKQLAYDYAEHETGKKLDFDAAEAYCISRAGQIKQEVGIR
jgi:hypothetical protein